MAVGNGEWGEDPEQRGPVVANVQAIQKKILVILCVLLVLMLGGLAVLQARTMDISLFAGEPHEDLVDSVRFAGTVGLGELCLSEKEVSTINRSVRRHGRVFQAVDMVLDRKDPFDIHPVSDATTLDVTMTMKTDGAQEVCCLQKAVTRKALVHHVVRTMRRARSAVGKAEEARDGRKHFKRLYF